MPSDGVYGYLILLRCLGSEGHSELLLAAMSACLADSRSCRRRERLGGRGRADDDMPAIESSFSSRSSPPEVLGKCFINF
jgi:hypothetical protein